MDKDCFRKFYEEYHELILHLKCGEKFEVHCHDVELEDCHIVNDKGEDGTAIPYDSIVAVDWHESGWE